MDQSQAPLVDALAAIERHRTTGFGAPGHHQGAAIPRGLRRLLGGRAFAADVLTPKGLDDRTESTHAVQRAHELAARAWGAELCRFSTGGSTQSLHTLLAAVARPGETVILAGNVHKAEWSAAIFAGLHPVAAPATIDGDWDVEHGVAAATLAATVAAHPHARAVVVVSPTYYGVTSDIVALARIAHDAGMPLIVDAAWGGAFPFSPRLPANPLDQGADAAVASLHKTMGALGQGSVLLTRGEVIDQERVALAYELFQTTSPSVAIMASIDATRRDHALEGDRIWNDLLDLAAGARARLAEIDGVRVLGPDRLDGDGAFELDESKILLDISRLGVAGYAVDDWLMAHHRLSIGLSDARHLLAIVGLGTTRGDLDRLARGLGDLVAKLRRTPDMLPVVPPALPRIGSLGFDLAMPPADAFFAPATKVPLEAAAGRIAAEIVAPAPPGIPRLIPGQRIDEAHVAWLVANRDAGMFLLDPADPGERCVRVVA